MCRYSSIGGIPEESVPRHLPATPNTHRTISCQSMKICSEHHFISGTWLEGRGSYEYRWDSLSIHYFLQKFNIPHSCGCSSFFCVAALTKHARRESLSSPAILRLRPSAFGLGKLDKGRSLRRRGRSDGCMEGLLALLETLLLVLPPLLLPSRAKPTPLVPPVFLPAPIADRHT